jgi:hypothetical protein
MRQTYRPNLSPVSRVELDAISVVVTQTTNTIINEKRYRILSQIIPHFDSLVQGLY